MDKKNTFVSIKSIDEVIKTLEFCDTNYVSETEFKSVFGESQINDMIGKLLNVRRRLIEDLKLIEKREQL